jgi:hypothetical protein
VVSEQGRRWHQALAYALTGERRADLGRQDTPDLDALLAALPAGPYGAYPVPADLLAGIGPAQFAAVLTQLRARLPRGTAPVLVDRPLTAEERRLVADAPPHHS